jgi:hypothetical protein
VASPFLFDYAKGRWVEKYSLPLGGDAIGVVLLQASGLQADATLNNYQYLSQLLAGGTGNLEATFTNYARIWLTAASGITISVNTSTGVTTVDIPNQVWSAAGGALNNSLGAFTTCYRPTSSTADSGISLMTNHPFAISVAGGTLTATVPSIGTTT